jgi:hypothetical protein
MALSAAVHNNGQNINFLGASGLVITTAVSATATTPVELLTGAKYIAFQVRFVYGSGGTTAKFFLQTTFDGGATWCDIAQHARTTASLNTVSAIVAQMYFSNDTDHPIPAPVIPYTLTDGTLGDNVVVQGLIGSQLRLKYVTTGTYAGSTTAYASAVVKG